MEKRPRRLSRAGYLLLALAAAIPAAGASPAPEDPAPLAPVQEPAPADPAPTTIIVGIAASLNGGS